MSVNARQINEQEAQLKAEKFFGKQGQNHSNMRRAPRKAPKLILASNREELYVFNDKANGGYIVIGGDDRMPDVLAYSYDGLYDDNDIPDNMKAWMDDYAEQVAYLKMHPEAKVKKKTATERENISPLLTCWFNQDSPYNNKCPEVDGERCPTGCVATAMAQIMYYYQWPKQTTSVIPGYNYTLIDAHDTDTFNIVLPDQPIATIEWENICSKYGYNYSDEEADAISTLMLLCGTAVKMIYSPGGSGSSEYYAAKALRKYFDYDDLLEVISRDVYDIDIWEEVIYDELRNNRPVYYGGSDKYGGHAFIMDGYEDGYFHVNWGWGGAYSYVLMTDVGGFNLHQSAIVGIQPAYPDTPSRYAVLDNGKMTLYYDNEIDHRIGTVIPHRDDWVNYANDITACVIDPSFANLKQRSLNCYFYCLNQLKQIEGIENLRTDNVIDMEGMFYGCSSLTNLDLSGFKTDNVRNVYAMFKGCTNLTNLDVSGFKTDNVTNMGSMFRGCSGLTSLDVSGFKTDNVTDMGGMFSLCSGLTSLDVSGFKTDNVMDMGFMFNDCSSLTSLDVSGFKTDNVTDMTCMFYRCISLTSLDVTGFKTDNVTRMHDMFRYCKVSSLDVSGFKTDNVTDMGGMFAYCSGLTSLDVSGFKTDKVTNMSGMFSYCTSLTSLDVSGFKTDNVTNMSGMFENCTNLTSLDVSGFKTGNVSDMNNMFRHCLSLTSLDVKGFKTDCVTDMGGMFSYCTSLISLDLSSFKTDNVTNMKIMFLCCTCLTSLDVSGFKTGNVSDMSSMFEWCSSLKKIYVGEEWTTKNITNGDHMFDKCYKLVGGAGTRYTSNNTDYTYAHIDGGMTNPGYFRDKKLPDPLEPYALLSEENTLLTFYYDDQMESRGGMDVYEHQWYDHRREIATVVFDDSFAGCMTLTSMSNWFSGCSKLSNIVGLGYLRTDNVTDMRNMFSGCSSLTSLDLSSFKTDNVTNTEWMFSDCSSLTSLDLSSFKTDNVTNMGYMFYGCSSLTRLDLSSFKTDNVTFMHYMFYGCSSLKKIYVASGWTTLNVKYGDYMFGGCTKLIGGAGTRYSSYNYNNNHASYAHIDGGPSNPGFFRDRNMPDFDPYILLSNNNTVLTFYCDDQMETRQGIDVYDQAWSSHSADIITVVFDESFVYCTTLTSTATWFKDFSKLSNIVGLDNLRTDNVTDMGYMFYGCSCLTSLNLSSFKTDNVTFMPYMFENCENLTTIYVREGWNTSNVGMSVNMFSNCPKLVGGEGTTYDKNHTSADYAHIDGGVSNPGYLTYKDYYNTLIYIVDGEEYRSYRLEIGEEITPEPKPTKEGYVFLGWDNIPATMPDYDVVVNGTFYLYGDVNTDKDVDVLDVVDIARYVVEIPSESFVKQLADINKDGNVNLGDAVTLVNEIAGEQNFVRAKASPKDNYTNDVLSLTEWNGCLSLNLQNERYYTAFQFDLYVPEGSDVTKMSLNTKRKQGHQLLYNKVKDGHYRVAALSTSNNEFIGKEGELMNIVMNGVSDDEVSVRDIHFFDVKGNDYLFDDIYGSTVTSVRQIDNGKLIMDNSIYDLQGRKRLALQRGVNIVGGKKVVIK